MAKPRLRPAHGICLLLLAGVAAWLIFPTRGDGSRGGDGRGGKKASASTGALRSADREDPTVKRLRGTRSTADDAAVEAWYQRLLEKYPMLRPHYRDVPDEENGLLQLSLLLDEMRTLGNPVPDDLKKMLRGQQTWDPEMYRQWLATHDGEFQRILRIAEMPDRSAKGFDPNRTPFTSITDLSLILRASARLEMEGGNPEAALRYAKASLNLSDHLTQNEAPLLIGAMISASDRAQASRLFRDVIAPSLDPAARAAWQEALAPPHSPASDYHRYAFGEWNMSIRSYVLPSLLRDGTVMGRPVSDADAFIDAYTGNMLNVVEGIRAKGPGRFDLPSGVQAISMAPPGQDAEVTNEMVGGFSSTLVSLGRSVTRAAMERGVFSIPADGEIPMDPVSGQPFRWDPATRTLSAPEGVEGVKPIVLPWGDP